MKKQFFIFALISLFIYSCDLLTTRSSEPPDKTGSNYIPASNPGILFDNLKSSVEKNISENYMACMVDSSYLKKEFLFTPASGTITQYPVFTSWNLQYEKQYFNNLKANLQQASKASLSYTVSESTPQGDSAIYVLDYNLNIVSSNSILSGDYKGTARFKIFLDSRNQWVIVEWQDIKKDNFYCWSDLKGRTY